MDYETKFIAYDRGAKKIRQVMMLMYISRGLCAKVFDSFTTVPVLLWPGEFELLQAIGVKDIRKQDIYNRDVIKVEDFGIGIVQYSPELAKWFVSFKDELKGFDCFDPVLKIERIGSSYQDEVREFVDKAVDNPGEKLLV